MQSPESVQAQMNLDQSRRSHISKLDKMMKYAKQCKQETRSTHNKTLSGDAQSKLDLTKQTSAHPSQDLDNYLQDKIDIQYL